MRENVGDLHFFVVDNFDFPRKFFGQKFDFSNRVQSLHSELELIDQFPGSW